MTATKVMPDHIAPHLDVLVVGARAFIAARDLGAPVTAVVRLPLNAVEEDELEIALRRRPVRLLDFTVRPLVEHCHCTLMWSRSAFRSSRDGESGLFVGSVPGHA